MAAPDGASHRRLQRLLRLGERLGYLTYEMLNDKLPDGITAAAELDKFLQGIERQNIRLIHEKDEPETW